MSWRSGAPLRTDRWFIEYCPVKSEARDGPQGFVTEKLRVNVTASLINWRKLGKSTCVASAPVRQSARSWSITINRTLRGLVIWFPFTLERMIGNPYQAV